MPRPLTIERFPEGLRRRMAVAAAQQGIYRRDFIINAITTACLTQEHDEEMRRETDVAMATAGRRPEGSHQ